MPAPLSPPLCGWILVQTIRHGHVLAACTMIRALEALGRFEADMRARAVAVAPAVSPPLTPPRDEEERKEFTVERSVPIDKPAPRRSTRRRVAEKRKSKPAELPSLPGSSKEKPEARAASTPRKRRSVIAGTDLLVEGAPPTPESLPRKRPRRKATTVVVELPTKGHLFPTPISDSGPGTTAPQDVVVAPNEDGNVEKVDKIWLIQGESGSLSLSIHAGVLPTYMPRKSAIRPMEDACGDVPIEQDVRSSSETGVPRDPASLADSRGSLAG